MEDKTRKLVEIIEKRNKLSKLMEGPNLVKLNNTSYPNVKFDNDGTQNDYVNDALLSDLQKAAQSVGIVITITTAKTGHNSLTINGRPSRHMDGTGVDVAILDGIGSGNASNSSNGVSKFRVLGNKIKDALVSMGYTWNVESGNDKAVLWQTDTGGNHYNHLHVSNRTGESGSPTKTSTDSDSSTKTSTDSDSPTKTSTDNISSTKTSTDVSNVSSALSSVSSTGRGGMRYSGADNLLGDIAGKFLKMKESKEYGNFGKNASVGTNKIVLPFADNPSIDANISGKIVKTNFLGCNNELSIYHKINDTEYYLTYCDITYPSVSIGDKVRKGDKLGTTKNDVSIHVFDTMSRKLDFLSIDNIDNSDKKKKKEKKDKDEDDDYSSYNKYKGPRRYSNPDEFIGDAIKFPFKVLSRLTKGGLKSVTRKKDDDEKTGKPFKLPGGLKSVTSKKVDEEIERIKRLLK